jgi:hypothetical protein
VIGSMALCRVGHMSEPLGTLRDESSKGAFTHTLPRFRCKYDNEGVIAVASVTFACFCALIPQHWMDWTAALRRRTLLHNNVDMCQCLRWR